MNEPTSILKTTLDFISALGTFASAGVAAMTYTLYRKAERKNRPIINAEADIGVAFKFYASDTPEDRDHRIL